MVVIAFNALLSPWLILALLGPLTVFLLWVEWTRKHSFLAVRLLAVVVLVFSLAAILLRPVYETSSTREVMLLTPGYAAAQADSLLTVHPGIQLRHTPGTTPYKKSKPLSSYRDLASMGHEVTLVVGTGLPASALDVMDQKRYTFVPTPARNGIVSIVTGAATVYQRADVNGTFVNAGGRHTVVIQGPAATEDSVYITKEGSSDFTLTVTPRQAGNYLYKVIVRDSAGSQTTALLPLHVEPFKALSILFLQPYPTFESQYLKNFLSDKGHRVVLRYQLSKQTYRYEYANREPLEVNRLTPAVLNRFDLVIAEPEALQKLSKAEKSILADAVQNGLGLLPLGPFDQKEKDVAAFFPFKTIPVKTDTAILTLHGKPQPLPALSWRVSEAARVQPLLQNKSGILIAYTQEGLGKIGAQVLQETYRLSLAGDSTGYSMVWSPLLQHIARTTPLAASIQVTDPFPLYPDEPVHIRLLTTQPKPALQSDSTTIPLEEDVTLDDVWHATAWAGEPGWHTLETAGVGPQYYYVSEAGSWPTLRQANLLAVNSTVMQGNAPATEQVMVREEMSPLLFFICFALAAGFIWLSPKLSHR